LTALQENPTINPAIKGIIKELSYNINVLAEDFRSSFYVKAKEVGIQPKHEGYFDVDTGTPQAPTEANYIFDDNYKAETITNLNSALICSTGNYEDTGKQCH
jgi:hypothetical protein